MVQNAVIVREKLQNIGIEATVVNACFVKPIDKLLIEEFMDKGFSIVTIEDNVITGGLGSLVLQFVTSKCYQGKILNLGFKDEFVPHGNVDILYKIYNLDVDGIYSSILNLL
ncbi:1-deoxy-D-xylulose-5-phosphate synthase [bioreactor metagenome]